MIQARRRNCVVGMGTENLARPTLVCSPSSFLTFDSETVFATLGLRRRPLLVAPQRLPGKLARGMGQPGTVLVVDDEPSIRLLCKVNLELEGYRVLEAGTLDEARAWLEGDAVDVILLDVHVAGHDGRHFLREVRERGPGPAVAYLSGTFEIEKSGEGADAVITKPFALEDLSRTVARLAAIAPVAARE